MAKTRAPSRPARPSSSACRPSGTGWAGSSCSSRWAREALQLAAFFPLQLSADGRRLALYRDTRVELWELVLSDELRPYGEGGTLEGTCLSPDGRLLLAHGAAGVHVHAGDDGRVLAQLPVGKAMSALFLPGGTALVTSAAKGIHRWPVHTDPKTGAVRFGPPEPVAGDKGTFGIAARSHDGTALAAVGPAPRPQAVLLREGGTGPVPLPHPHVKWVSLSPDGKWAATGTWNGSGVRVWDVATGEQARELPLLGSTNVAFSPDGRWLLTGNGRAYQFWEVGSWNAGPEIRRQDTAELAGVMAFSADGRLLAVTGSRRDVFLVDVPTARTLARVEAPWARAVDSLSLSPGGDRLVATSGSLIMDWDLRRVRARLAEMSLDWELPPYPPAPPQAVAPPAVEVELGELAPEQGEKK